MHNQGPSMRSPFTLSAIFAALAVCSGATHANLLVNGSFEALDASAAPYYVRSFASTPGWTQYADGVDLIHNNYEQPSLPVLVDASDGVQFLDMNQGGAIGGLFQVVGASAGVAYTLQLDITAWATNSVPGSVGYQLYDPVSNAVLAQGSLTDAVADNSWATVSLTATALSGSIGVNIYGISAHQAGMGVDNVVLSAVPEPGNWALLLAGAGLLQLQLRRQRR